MLKRLHLRNFTVFADAEFEFGAGLNVLVGANGTGKTHVLKAGYVGEYARNSPRELLDFEEETNDKLTYALAWVNSLRRTLFDVFLLDALKPLIRKNATETIVETTFNFPEEETSFKINYGDGADRYKAGSLDIKTDEISLIIGNKNKDCVFIPAKEVLTLGWIFALYDRREIPVDKTYPDILKLLMGPPLRQPEPAHIVEKLAQLIGGKVEEEGGHFYLSAPDQPRLEMNLVAEGMRKFATLYKLLANGTLTPETTLFWDEPEANLNPALLKEMAAVLTDLAEAGFQIILATHSLFLLKELHILAQAGKAPMRYFGLSAQPGEAVTVATADNLELLPDIVALDAELEQADRFQRVLDQADANRN
jgi:hypothetical protein